MHPITTIVKHFFRTRSTLTIALLSAFVFRNGYSQQVNYWTALPKPTPHTLSRVHFVDTLQGWITGQNGVFMKTTDGGLSWIQQLPGATGEIPDLFVRTPKDVRAIEFHYPVDDTSWYGTIIHHSTDGGNSWTQQRFDSALFRTIMFQDSLTGFLGGSYGMIAKTTDGGTTWKNVNIGTFVNQDRWPIYKVRFHSKSFGMAVAGQLDVFGIVWKTTDGGETWKSSKISGDPLFDVIFFDSLHVLCAMGDLESSGAGFLRSLDGGETWSFENTTIWGEPSTFAFRTPNEMWVPMGTAGICLRSTNNGMMWENIKLPQQIPVYDISFPSERTGFMVGHFGALFKFNSSILSVHGSAPVPRSKDVVQNYPNPFNGSTIFSFTLPQRSHVTITVYDVVGRMAAVVVEDVMESGDQSVRWDTGDLPSGMYLYRLQHGSRTFSGKVILQR